MNKTALFLVLASLAAPAFATHPNELCVVKLDMAAVTRTAGVDASSVRVHFVFGGGIANMTDMSPRAAEVAARPAEGPWIYSTEVRSNLYYRTLRAVVVESMLYKPVDGTPEWSVRLDRPADGDPKKDAPISCLQYAD